MERNRGDCSELQNLIGWTLIVVIGLPTLFIAALIVLGLISLVERVGGLT
jgi:hypothetical protein